MKPNGKKKKLLPAIVIGGVVLLIIGGAAFYFTGGLDRLTKRQTGLEGAPKELSKADQAQVDANSLIYNVTPDTSDKEAEKIALELYDLVAKSESVEAKEKYQTALVDLYSITEQHDKLLDAARQLDAIKPTTLSAGWVGLAYERLERYADAAKYYQLAAERSPKSENPSSDTPYNRYMAEKRRMEEKL